MACNFLSTIQLAKTLKEVLNQLDWVNHLKKFRMIQFQSFSSTTADAEMATELHLTSPVRSFCIRASTVRDRNGWLDALNTAIEDHNSRKATFFNNDQRIECKMGVAPPIWVPDRRVSMCQKCTAEFTVLVRRHHCRACGQVVCSNCSANKAPLRYFYQSLINKVIK